MDACAGTAFKKADAELNGLYRRITGRLKDDVATLNLLVAAERAWVSFRDAECRFANSGSADGSVYPMIMAQCEEGLTRGRITDLTAYLNCQEGDLSCPVPRQ